MLSTKVGHHQKRDPRRAVAGRDHCQVASASYFDGGENPSLPGRRAAAGQSVTEEKGRLTRSSYKILHRIIIINRLAIAVKKRDRG
jgi:hypothetical protein